MTASEPHSEEKFCPSCESSFPEGDLCPNDGSQLVLLRAQPDTFLGTTIDGRFAIQEKIASGGMGTVYRARQVSVGRDVALKIIHPRYVGDPAVAKRFLREARIASSLGHPNTVSVFDFGQTADGVLYLVMELLAGKTLADVLVSEGSLSPKRAAWVGVQICDALEIAHSRGVVHRDLKPSNIMLLDEPRDRDVVKVLDFGLAKSIFSDVSSKATRTDQIVGTPAYMAPELMHGAEASPTTDMYSLGAVLFELLTGSAPKGTGFEADALFDALAPPGSRVPPSLASLVVRLLSLFPNERPASAATVREALVAAMEQAGTPLLPVAEARAGDLDAEAEVASRSAASYAPEGRANAAAKSEILEPVRRASKAWVVLAVVALLAGAVALVALFIVPSVGPSTRDSELSRIPNARPPTGARPRGRDENTAVAPPGPVPSAVDTAALPRGEEAPEVIELSVESQPSDVQVRIDGALLGRTPMQTTLARGDGTVRLELSRRGYKTVTQTIVPDRDRAVSVALRRNPPRAEAPREEFIVPRPPQ